MNFNLKFNAASDSGLKNAIFSVYGVPNYILWQSDKSPSFADYVNLNSVIRIFLIENVVLSNANNVLYYDLNRKQFIVWIFVIQYLSFQLPLIEIKLSWNGSFYKSTFFQLSSTQGKKSLTAADVLYDLFKFWLSPNNYKLNRMRKTKFYMYIIYPTL